VVEAAVSYVRVLGAGFGSPLLFPEEPMPTDIELALWREIGARLKLTRHAIWGRNRKKFLADMGVSKNQISDWEKGEREVPQLLVYQLHDQHGVCPRWLSLGDKRQMPVGLWERIERAQGAGGKKGRSPVAAPFACEGVGRSRTTPTRSLGAEIIRWPPKRG
jgi:hypothetical protein